MKTRIVCNTVKIGQDSNADDNNHHEAPIAPMLVDWSSMFVPMPQNSLPKIL